MDVNQWSFSFKAQSESMWQQSKQLASGVSKHNQRGGYTLLTPNTLNGFDCASEVTGLMGNRNKCAQWMAQVDVGTSAFPQEFKAVSQGSAGTQALLLSRVYIGLDIPIRPFFVRVIWKNENCSLNHIHRKLCIPECIPTGSSQNQSSHYTHGFKFKLLIHETKD